MASLGRRHVPVLDRLAAHPARRHRPGQPQGPRLLRPARRQAGGGRDQADADALPLGPPADLRGPRRLARARDRRALRRLRRDRRRPPLRPRPHLVDPERAVVRGVPRLRQRPPRAGPHRARGRARGRPPPQPRPRPRGPGAARRRGRPGLDRAQPDPVPRRGRGRPGRRRHREPGLLRPDPARPVPGRRHRAHAPPHRLVLRAGGRPRHDQPADRPARDQLLQPDLAARQPRRPRERGRTRARSGSRAGPPRAWSSPTWAGRSTRRA